MDHINAFKVKYDALNTQSTKHAAILAATVEKAKDEALFFEDIKKIQDKAFEAYKRSNEFGSFGCEYLERGIKTNCRWVV